MSTINGCNLPENLFYLIKKHVWAKPIEDGKIRVGMTTVAAKLSGGKLTAITVKTKNIGKEVTQGRSVATVESSKFVGPVPAPVTGVLVRGNDQLTENPNLAVEDPYQDGWIVEMQPSNWESDKDNLATGSEGLTSYQALLEDKGISCK
jgi:glycine cleavage system H protein